MKPRLTKSAPFIIMFLVMLQSIYSQDYLLTFSGSGQSSTVEIVEVKNIDQQTTLTLNGTDTLLLTDVVGTGYLPKLSHGMIIYPNPANHASRLEFYNSSAGNTSIEIYDFSGRLLINQSLHLTEGNHAFSISGLKAGIYLVMVNSPEHIYSQRLVSISDQGLIPELQYEGITQIRPQAPGLKSTSNIVAMQYNEGERLVIKAISGNYAHTKSLVPTESQHIDFEFIDCVDGDGNLYGVVTIGEQVWMAENLKTTQYINGTPIEYPGPNNSAWQNNNTGAYAWYNNDISWEDSYGALYNWHAVNNSNGLCPTGWHVPSHFEWTQLEQHVCNSIGHFNCETRFPYNYSTIGYRGTNEGNTLKFCRQVSSPLGDGCNTSVHPRWSSHNTHYGVDEFGFSAFPAGVRNLDEAFYGLGDGGYWWSSMEHLSVLAWYRTMTFNTGTVYRGFSYKTIGNSVRCLRDNERAEVD